MSPGPHHHERPASPTVVCTTRPDTCQNDSAERRSVPAKIGHPQSEVSYGSQPKSLGQRPTARLVFVIVLP